VVAAAKRQPGGVESLPAARRALAAAGGPQSDAGRYRVTGRGARRGLASGPSGGPGFAGIRLFGRLYAAVGKALAGGFPLSACMGKAEVMDAWRHNSHDAPHSSTFMGHPMGCAAAFAAIGEIEAKGLVQRAREMGVVLGDRLKRLKDKYPIVGDVRNLGLMAGIELVRDRDSKEPATEETRRVVDSALRRGVILTKGGAYGNVLSISPPLVITEEQLCFALDILDEALAAI